MPTHNLVFMLILVLIIPIAALMVLGAERLQHKKAARAQDALKTAALNFMRELAENGRKYGKATLKLNAPPAVITKFKGVPPNMQTHPALGALKMMFYGGCGLAVFWLAGIAATAIVAILGLLFYQNGHIEPKVVALCVILLLVIWLFLLVMAATLNCPLALFYEHGVLLAEKRRLGGLANAHQQAAPYADVYNIDVLTDMHRNQFSWACRFILNNGEPFIIKQCDYKSLRQLIQCFENARF